MEKYMVNLPNPCHEDWDKMAPKENGKFCASCEKVVVDFQNMSDEELQQYFLSLSNTKVCGRFRHDQVEESPIHLKPWENTLISNYFRFLKDGKQKWSSRWMAMLLGLAIFATGCKKKTNPVGTLTCDPQTEDSVKNRNDTTLTTMGAPVKLSSDTVKYPDPMVGEVAYPDTTKK